MTINPESRFAAKLAHPSIITNVNQGLLLGGDSSFNPARDLFAGGVKGLLWDFSDPSRLFSDAGTTPAVIDGPIGRVGDRSPNGITGNQATGGSKPLWKTSGGKFFALFDGTDDWLQAAGLDLSGTDKATVFAGVRKLSDAATAMVVEFSASATTNAGAFYLTAPESNGATKFGAVSRGTVTSSATTTNVAYNAPVTANVRLSADIPGDALSMFVNGVLAGTSATDQGTGNYGNYPVYLGRRGGTLLPFNGQIFALCIVGRACTPAEISSMEAWMNSRTGAY